METLRARGTTSRRSIGERPIGPIVDSSRQRSSRHALARPGDLVRKSRETASRRERSPRDPRRLNQQERGWGRGEGTDHGLPRTFAFQGYARSRAGSLAREQQIRRIVRPPIYRSSAGEGGRGRGAEMAERR